MKNKRHYNNLFDSIQVTLLLLVCFACYLLLLWFGVINHKEGTSPVLTLIIGTILFGSMIIAITVIIVKNCYEYWFLSADSIVSKKMFARRVIIKLADIERVEKKKISAFVLGLYSSEAYLIYSKNSIIVILTDDKRKRYPELRSILSDFIT